MDGTPWRVVPDSVVVRCGLAAGTELDRPLLRLIRAELRRAEALGVAGRTLQMRALSRRRLDDRLARAGTDGELRSELLETLERAGLLDDERLARARAESLAERGWGNEAIVARLGSEGLDEDVARAAAAELAPEGDRAGRLAGTETDPRRIASLLSRRGFGEDVVQAALARLDADG